VKKLIFAILRSDATEPILRALTEDNFTATQLSSLGGFLRRGNVTLVVGVEPADLERALAVIRAAASPLSKGEHHAATIFVVEASQFIQS
jgi:uncharacterized protein YaaQ